ncbi:MAG: calcium/proton exchanger [Candidatus Dormibacteraceae bacterium]
MNLKPRLEWLLISVPISLLLAGFYPQPILLFISAGLAIIPLAGLISQATEELALRSSPRISGLLGASFGNITEIIIAVLLIRAGEIEVVKASLIGSILGNLVLVLGASLFAGGLRFKEQRFSARSASAHAASLLMAVTGLVLPTLFALSSTDTSGEREIVSIGVAAILIALYGASLIFSLGTHQYLFRSSMEGEPSRWSVRRAVALLLLTALAVGLESELLVNSLAPTVAALGVSRLFIGLFVVATVGNAAEHAAAVQFAIRNKLDLSMEISFGSSTQIALLVAPALVIGSLVFGRPMDFIFSPLEVTAVALATLITALLTTKGRSSWLEGLQLLGAYAIMAVSFFFVREP